MDRDYFLRVVARLYQHASVAFWESGSNATEISEHEREAMSCLRTAASIAGFDLVPRKSSEASRADHEYRVLNGCEPPVTEATDKFDGRNSSRVDQPIIHHQV